MSLKSRSIFKKFLPVFLLLLIVAVIFVPFEAAKAAGDLLSFDIFGNIEDWIAKALLGDNVFMRAIYFLIYQALNICLLVVTILVYFGSWLVDVFLDEAIYTRVLNMGDPTSAVSIGWTTIRDACNTFFILFLLLIAFSTILRIQTYNAKSLLPKFIISLFLINFSATIAMMVIDFGQVFMFEIKSWMGAGGFSEAGSPLTTIVDRFNLKYNFKSPTEKYLLEDVVGIGFAVAYSVVLGLLYIMLALFLLVRIIVFVVLVIISPFAFFSIILPGMRTYTSQWWSSLVSHAIFGPVFLFFIFLSGKMAQSMHGFTSTVNKPVEMDSLSFIIAELIPHVVALGMLFAAIPVTQKLGVAGSSKIIGGAAGIGKIAAGTYAGVKLAGGLGKKTGGGIDNRIMKGKVSDWGRRKKEGVLKSRALLGLGKGTALKSQAETERKKEDNMKKVRLEFGEAKSRDLDLLQQKANGKLATKEDKALFAETAVAHGKSGEEGYAKDIAKFMPEIERTLSGKELSEITDKNLVLATHTSEAQKDIKSDAKTDEQIMKEKMDDIVADGKAHEVQGLDNAMATKAWHDGQTSEQRKSSMNRMNKERRNELADGYMANANKAGTEEGDRMEFSSNAVKLEKGLNKAFAWGGDDAAEKIKEAFSDFDHKTVAKLSSGDLDKHGYNTTDKQITGLEKAGEYKTVRRIKDSMAKHDPEKLNRINSGITNPSLDKGSGGETKPGEPGEKWKEKMEEKAGKGKSKGSGGSNNPGSDSGPKPEGGSGGGTSGSGESGGADNSKKSRRSMLSDESGSANLIGGTSLDKDKSSKDKSSSKSESQSKKTGSEKIKEAYLKTNIAIGEADKIALKTIGKVDKRVGLANKVVLPAVDKAIEVNKRKLADPNLTNKQIRKEEIEKFKNILKPVVSENADEGVKVVGDGAGATLKEFGKKKGGKVGVAATVAGTVLQNKKAQKIISKEVRKKAETKPQSKKSETGQTITSQQSQKTDLGKINKDLVKSESEIETQINAVSHHAKILPNCFKRDSKGLGKIAAGLEKSGVDEKTANLFKQKVIEQRKAMIEESTTKNNMDVYYEGKGNKILEEDTEKHKEVNPNDYIKHLQKGDLQAGKIKEQLGKVDKLLGDMEIMHAAGGVFGGRYEKARSYLKDVEKAQGEEKQVYLTMAKHILDNLENNLNDKNIRKALEVRTF